MEHFLTSVVLLFRRYQEWINHRYRYRRLVSLSNRAWVHDVPLFVSSVRLYAIGRRLLFLPLRPLYGKIEWLQRVLRTHVQLIREFCDARVGWGDPCLRSFFIRRISQVQSDVSNTSVNSAIFAPDWVVVRLSHLFISILVMLFSTAAEAIDVPLADKYIFTGLL